MKVCTSHCHHLAIMPKGKIRGQVVVAGGVTLALLGEKIKTCTLVKLLILEVSPQLSHHWYLSSILHIV